MRAACVEAYGGTEHVMLREVERPAPRRGEIAIQVVASCVNSADWRMRSLEVPRGFRMLTRLAMGFSRPRQPIFGTELSGVVCELGEGVSNFRVGDEVIAVPGTALGAHAEYKVMRADARVIERPRALSFAESAALCFGGLTALHYLRAQAKLAAGERLLVIGAAGTVGSAAVQLGRVLGADVTGVCSGKNVERVRALGASKVLDYTQTDFTQDVTRYDAIFDCVGVMSYARARKVLAPGGRLLRAVTDLGDMLLAPWQGRFAGHRVIAGVSTERTEDMRYLAALAQSGAYRPLVDSILPFERIAEAHDRAASHRKHGSVVVEVSTPQAR